MSVSRRLSRSVWPEPRGLFRNKDGASSQCGVWKDYDGLPAAVRYRADMQFARLKADTQHPSLRFKKIGIRDGNEVWSARVTLQYRALAIRLPDEFLWFWIGEHDAYDALIA